MTETSIESGNDASGASERARVVIIDSGVHRAHPHIMDRAVGGIIFGPTVMANGELQDDVDQTDRLGHGTCAAAAILDLSPDAELVSVKVFHDVPTCPIPHVLTALEWTMGYCTDGRKTLVNLSLGTPKHEWRGPFEALVARALELGLRLVAPATFNGLPSYPGVLPGVDGVLVDASLPRESPEFRDDEGHAYWYASPFPRDLPGLPRPVNLAGGSLACANVVAWLAAVDS